MKRSQPTTAGQALGRLTALLITGTAVGGTATSNALAQTFALTEVWAAEAGDWNGDGVVDAALILGPSQDGEDAGLALYLSDSDTGRLELSAWHPRILWGNRAMFGQEPSLLLDDLGRLVVVTQNTAIGRNRWQQSLTLRWDQSWQVDAFSYDYFDTLDLEHQGRCDLDFIAQSATVVRGESQEQEVFELAAAPPPKLKEWQNAYALVVCGLVET